MSAYVYASGSYHPLEGNQIVSGGQLVTMKDSDAIVVDGSRYTLGDPVASDVQNLYSGRVIAGVNSSYTSVTLEDMTVAAGAIVTLQGGIVKNMNVASGGSAVIEDAECLDQFTVNSSGHAVISNSIVRNVVVNGSGAHCVLDGCSVDSARGATYGLLTVSSATLNNVLLNDNSVSMNIADGGIVNNVSNGGCLNVSSGGIVFSGRVSTLYVRGGSAQHVHVGGRMYVSGGNVYDIRYYRQSNMLAYDTFHISSGTVRALSAYGISAINIGNGGSAADVTITDGGKIFVDSGGLAQNVYMSGTRSIPLSSGTSYIIQSMTVEGEASNVTMSGGSCIVNSGGTITNLNVSGTTVLVSSGGVALNVSRSGGTISAYEGSIVTYANN